MSEGNERGEDKRELSAEVARVVTWLRKTADRWEAITKVNDTSRNLRFCADVIQDHYGKKIDATQGLAYEGANREEI